MRYIIIVLVISIFGLTGVAAQAAGQDVKHEVKQGETLYGIARNYGLSVQTLSEINRIESPNLLLPGTILTIAREYVVQRGDTLYGIARRFNLPLAELQAANDLDSSVIRAGQRLRVPWEDTSAAIATRDPGTAPDPEAVVSDNGDGPRETTDNTQDRPTVIPIALSMDEPIPFSEGGSWPVAGRRTQLDGKLPGVLIRADRGTPVTAISGGRVVYAGPHSTFGNVVFVQSPQGYIYVYGGQEQVLVEVGDTITAGNTVGTVGLSPAEGTAALYFSVWRDNAFVDPESAPRG